MSKPTVDPSIFRDYDIRGIYPSQVNEETYYKIGRSIASYFHNSPIAVGYDARLSSSVLFEALSRGITDMGCDVIDLGLISTDMHNFASGFYQFPANVMISASHNPGQYNGIKIVQKGAVPIHGQKGLPEIKEIVMSDNITPLNLKRGSVSKKDILDDWIKFASGLIDLKKLKRIKVVIDAGNGVGGISWQKLIGKSAIEIIPLYFNPDGNFPHHSPDPLQKDNLNDLSLEIKKNQADLGFAIDGDGDRIFILDENGQKLSGTITTAILAKYFLKKYGPSNILYNVVVGKIVPETVLKNGGNPIRVRVGHSFIKETMKKTEAIFAGEHSGHFYFKDLYFADSSFVAGLYFLSFLSGESRKLSQIVKEFDKYCQSGEINFLVKDTDKIQEIILGEFPSNKNDRIDGLSIWYDKWWINLRASKTEPLLRLNLEADSKDILLDKLTKIEKIIIKEGGKRV
mgnify:CR=1 FL=1